MSFLDIYITFPTAEDAGRIVGQLLNKKIIACANIYPVQSSYWWEGRIEQAGEVAANVKTTAENWEKLVEEVKASHPDEVPCIVKYEVEANPEYEEWVKSETV